MENKIEKICVIGPGVMGLTIAALIANSSHRVVLLDVVSNDSNDRNAILTKALENIEKQRPAPLSHPSKLASNTSTLPLRKLKEQMLDSIKSTIRFRFVISHFFNPLDIWNYLNLL